MGFESVYLFRTVEVNATVTGSMTLSLYTQLPNGAMALRHSAALSTGVRPFEIRLPNGIRGKQYRLRISGTGTCRLYGIRVFARMMGGSAGFEWYQVPGIPAQTEGWSFVPLNIPEPSDAWSFLRLNIPEPSDDWQFLRLPVKDTPLRGQWVDLPVDAIE